MLLIEKYLSIKKKEVEEALEKYLSPTTTYPPIIHKAMRYSTFAGGKRIRPILAISACEAVGGNTQDVIPFAAALELIHTYSLIHDDLPSIDNDDYRRGKLTCHKKFGEAIAILSGDALLTLAFEIMSKQGITEKTNSSLVLRVIYEIAFAIGTSGMIGGQVVDIISENKSTDAPTLQYIHTHKTGNLICTSLRIGAILGGSSQNQLRLLTQYGEYIGLVFQIIDDILDIEGNKEVMGKSSQSDISKNKLTYPSVYGLEESKEWAKQLHQEALTSLESFDHQADPLREIAKFIVQRSY
ncbi:MAG: polyprenyl synthetase family protein [bacterium]|nr:polyprenyl synthetase family protein [bacterium]